MGFLTPSLISLVLRATLLVFEVLIINDIRTQLFQKVSFFFSFGRERTRNSTATPGDHRELIPFLREGEFPLGKKKKEKKIRFRLRINFLVPFLRPDRISRPFGVISGGLCYWSTPVRSPYLPPLLHASLAPSFTRLRSPSSPPALCFSFFAFVSWIFSWFLFCLGFCLSIFCCLVYTLFYVIFSLVLLLSFPPFLCSSFRSPFAFPALLATTAQPNPQCLDVTRHRRYDLHHTA